MPGMLRDERDGVRLEQGFREVSHPPHHWALFLKRKEKFLVLLDMLDTDVWCYYGFRRYSNSFNVWLK